jgi:TatD DNase family protein
MKYLNFHTHIAPDDPENIGTIISCVAPEPLQQCTQNMWLSYGIHPWYTHGQDLNTLLEAVKKAASNPNVLAIGEAGIDKVRGPALGMQEKIFYQQIKISEKYHKPLIIHSVKANNEIMHLRKNMSPTQPWVLHGFGGHPQEMQQFIDAGFYLSFGPKILYPN